MVKADVTYQYTSSYIATVEIPDELVDEILAEWALDHGADWVPSDKDLSEAVRVAIEEYMINNSCMDINFDDEIGFGEYDVECVEVTEGYNGSAAPVVCEGQEEMF
jgi:hypothetical protein